MRRSFDLVGSNCRCKSVVTLGAKRWALAPHGRAQRGGPREQARGEDGRVPRARHLRAVREGDGRGQERLPGALWFDIDKILATIAADNLKETLQAFEQAQQATRDEAIAAALERKAAAATEG